MRRAQEHTRWPECAFCTLPNLRNDTYRIVMIEVSQARSGKKPGALVRWRASADLMVSFRQRLPRAAGAVRNHIGGTWSSIVGFRMFPGRSSAAVPGPLAARKGERPRFDERHDLGGRTRVFLSRKERAAMQCAPDLLSLVSADDSFEHYPPRVINEVIVDRVISSEHSIDKRPVERVDKGFQIAIG